MQVYEADLAYTRRYQGNDIQALLATRCNVAGCLCDLDRAEEALPLLRDTYAESRDAFGREDANTLYAAEALAVAMFGSGEYAECAQFLRDNGLIDAVTRSLGTDHESAFALRRTYARALYSGEEPPLRDLRQAVEILEEVSRMSSRVMGPRHPRTLRSEDYLQEAREELARAEAPVAARTRRNKTES